MLRKSSCPGHSFAQGESIPSVRKKTGFKTREKSCPAWKRFSCRTCRARMKLDFTCPAWELALHARYENWLYMPGLKIGFLHARREKSTLYGCLENRLSVFGMKTNLIQVHCMPDINFSWHLRSKFWADMLSRYNASVLSRLKRYVPSIQTYLNRK